MSFELENDEFPFFCGARVLGNFPEDPIQFCTARANIKNRTGDPCEDCDVDFDKKGRFWCKTEYCKSPAALVESLGEQEESVRANRAGVAFATLDQYQTTAKAALLKRGWKVLHDFRNPNTNNRVFVLSKMLV
jgi:hypothetical protein